MLEKMIITPFQRFVKIESFSGILLFSAMIIALIWANSPFSDTYTSILNFELGFSSDSFKLTKPVILWINDGLMAVFFFLIGLEIKRELLIGELNSVKKASFPLLAAIGGMMIPLILYTVLNKNPEASHGWGVPMATDIAFSLAILKLLGKRVPLSLKIFLTAFAIVDDIGAVMVIAIFYNTGIQWMLLLYAFILLGILFFMAYKGIYIKYLSFLFAIVIWVLFLKAGIHPTIAGILMAFTIPIRQKINFRTYIDKLTSITDNIKSACVGPSPILTKLQIEEIDNLEDWTAKVQSPLQHLEHRLHNWVSFLIMPIFALANAGIVFGGGAGFDMSLVLVLAISLVAGNFIGVAGISLLSIKLKIAVLPEDVSTWQVIGVSALAGVGFTMSIFIANLAFVDHPVLMDSAKVGILLGSLIAGMSGFVILRIAGRKQKQVDQV
ncbi:Na+/H+ antiporter NhaA [Bacteroidota bacterium]